MEVRKQEGSVSVKRVWENKKSDHHDREDKKDEGVRTERSLRGHEGES